MKTNEKAFTRIELTATITALALLGTLAVPLLGTTRSDSDEATCFNNLRRIGHGVRMWGDDHADLPPWLTLVSEGGTRPDTGGKAGNAWVEYISLSNELVAPQVLSCPADQGAKVASGWGSGANGLANFDFRGNAISYFIGLHSVPERPRTLIAGDRNIGVNLSGTSCSPARLNNASAIQISSATDTNVAWTNEVHGTAGHLLSSDGSVMFLSSVELRVILDSPIANTTGTPHILRAR